MWQLRSWSTSPSAMTLVASARMAMTRMLSTLDHHLEGPRVEEITHQDAGLVAPDRVGGLLTAAHGRGVHHVVMQQGGGVDKLDDRRKLDTVRAAVAKGPRAKEYQHWAQTFAAAVDQILRDLVDQHHLGVQPLLDEPIYGEHIVGDQALDDVKLGTAVRDWVCDRHRRGWILPAVWVGIIHAGRVRQALIWRIIALQGQRKYTKPVL